MSMALTVYNQSAHQMIDWLLHNTIALFEVPLRAM